MKIMENDKTRVTILLLFFTRRHAHRTAAISAARTAVAETFRASVHAYLPTYSNMQFA
jgi:hypothetical protein